MEGKEKYGASVEEGKGGGEEERRSGMVKIVSTHVQPFVLVADHLPQTRGPISVDSAVQKWADQYGPQLLRGTGI
jgi:hypothetical protein